MHVYHKGNDKGIPCQISPLSTDRRVLFIRLIRLRVCHGNFALIPLQVCRGTQRLSERAVHAKYMYWLNHADSFHV